MLVRKNVLRALASCCAVTSMALTLAPAGASASQAHWYGQRTYGATALVLDSGTAAALTGAPPAGFGLTVAPVAPAYAANGAINFPITDSPFTALLTGNVDHSGGLSLSSATTTVDLTNFVISAKSQTLTADVSVTTGGSTTSLGPVDIVGLNFSGAHIGLGLGGLTVGPVQATLNDTALTAVGNAFGVYPKLGGMITSLPLGVATVRYQGWFL